MLKTNLVAQNQQATTQKTTTTQSQTNNQDVRTAARDLRDAIRSQMSEERAKVRAQAQAARAQRTITVRGADGSQTVVGPDGVQTVVGSDGSQTVVGVPPFGPFGPRDQIPPQAVDMAIGFFITVAVIIIGLPLARAFARRMDRRGSQGQVPAELSSQLSHLNQAVDAIALEVERISEGQRFTARLLSEQRDTARQTLPSGADR